MRRSILGLALLLIPPCSASACYDHGMQNAGGVDQKSTRSWEMSMRGEEASRWEEAISLPVAAGCAGILLMGVSLRAFARAAKRGRGVPVEPTALPPLAPSFDRPLRWDPAHDGRGPTRWHP